MDSKTETPLCQVERHFYQIFYGNLTKSIWFIFLWDAVKLVVRTRVVQNALLWQTNICNYVKSNNCLLAKI